MKLGYKEEWLSFRCRLFFLPLFHGTTREWMIWHDEIVTMRWWWSRGAAKWYSSCYLIGFFGFDKMTASCDRVIAVPWYSNPVVKLRIDYSGDMMESDVNYILNTESFYRDNFQLCQRFA